MALSKITTASLSDDSVDTAQIADDAIESAQLANNVAISTSGAITTTGAFTSPGIDDNADATAITIDSSENVGLGTTTPATSLEISGTSANTQGGAFPRIQITTTADNNPTYSGSLDIVEKQSSATSTAVFGENHVYGFRTMLDGFNNVLKWFSGSQVTVTERMGLDRDTGNLTLNTGNLVIGTSGKGIDFSAQTGGTALSSGDGTENPTTENEVLKHYEHGTFKPKMVSSGATFDYQGSGGQYGSGHYTRIGDIVFVDMNFDSDGGVSGTTSNSVQIQNLPFTGHTGTSMNAQYFYRRVSSSSYPHLMAQQYDNYISFLQSPDSGQWRSLPASEISFSDHRMKISGCYHIGTV
tara:strand:+ start:1230 stop:2291 length:1062 start_codon:yes stop_codon:yes gene_type:complete